MPSHLCNYFSKWHYGVSPNSGPRYSANKKETRQQYLTRLRRTAMRLPSKFLKASIKNLKTRCQRLYAAKGGQIEEGRSD